MNSALYLSYCLKEILKQDNFINSNSLLRLVHVLVKYLDDHKLTISMEFISY